MATNEHFLLANLVKTIDVVDNLAWTFDELVKNVKRERLLAKLKSGTRTDVLLKKVIQKLDRNKHLKLSNIRGQLGLKMTPRGIHAVKCALMDYPARKRRASHSAYSLRAREVLRLGKFLKERLMKDEKTCTEKCAFCRSNEASEVVGIEDAASEQLDMDEVDESLPIIVVTDFKSRSPTPPEASPCAQRRTDTPAPENTSVGHLTYLRGNISFHDVISDAESEAGLHRTPSPETWSRSTTASPARAPLVLFDGDGKETTEAFDCVGCVIRDNESGLVGPCSGSDLDATEPLPLDISQRDKRRQFPVLKLPMFDRSSRDEPPMRIERRYSQGVQNEYTGKHSRANIDYKQANVKASSTLFHPYDNTTTAFRSTRAARTTYRERIELRRTPIRDR